MQFFFQKYKYYVKQLTMKHKVLIQMAFLGAATFTSTEISLDDIEPEIKTITTSNEEIQKACPQLLSVALKTESLGDLPFADFRGKNVLSMEGIIGWINSDVSDSVLDLGIFDNLKSANSEENFLIKLNSPGGDGGTANEYVTKIINSNAYIYTYGKIQVSSAATNIFIVGDERYLDSDTHVIVHSVHVQDKKAVNISLHPYYKKVFMSGFPKSSNLYNKLQNFNVKMKESYRQESSTNISEECTSSLFKDRVDVNILPDDMLKLGLADYVINKENKTITSIDYDSLDSGKFLRASVKLLAPSLP